MTDHIDHIDIAALLALLDKATPGPWMDDCGDIGQAIPHDGNAEILINSPTIELPGRRGFIRSEDQDMTIALRNAAPALLRLAEAAVAMPPTGVPAFNAALAPFLPVKP